MKNNNDLPGRIVSAHNRRPHTDEAYVVSRDAAEPTVKKIAEMSVTALIDETFAAEDQPMVSPQPAPLPDNVVSIDAHRKTA